MITFRLQYRHGQHPNGHHDHVSPYDASDGGVEANDDRHSTLLSSLHIWIYVAMSQDKMLTCKDLKILEAKAGRSCGEPNNHWPFLKQMILALPACPGKTILAYPARSICSLTSQSTLNYMLYAAKAIL